MEENFSMLHARVGCLAERSTGAKDTISIEEFASGGFVQQPLSEVSQVVRRAPSFFFTRSPAAGFEFGKRPSLLGDGAVV
ncbi:MAG: hypothetical protein M0Q43_13955, partial [Methanothrix sp.]|nr:hypothetical protein [Methanothrix sp.]